MNIYLAAPIVGISDEIKHKKQDVVKSLRIAGLNVYNPAEHGVPNAWGMSMEEWARCIFTIDTLEIEKCDWVVVCDFGRSTTAGTAWECGYAFRCGKKILVIEMMDDKTDYSVMMRGSSSNYCGYKEFISTPFDKIENYFVERGRQSQRTVLN